MMRRRLLYAVGLGLTLGLTLALAGCQNGGDKTGGDTVVLKFATIDGSLDPFGVNYGPAAFVAGLEEVSGGRLRADVITEFGGGKASAESELVAAIKAGEVDGGWPATRAFAAAGISGLEAVEAPMLITNFQAEDELVSGPVSDDLIDRLDGSGVVGLGLAAGGLRRPVGGKQLVSPQDWAGVRFRSYNSPVQRATVEALGGRPTQVGLYWMNWIEAGRLDGAEFDVIGLAGVDGGSVRHVTSNVVLWPKVFVLTLGEQTWKRLSDAQRGWVEQAAGLATRASVNGKFDESAAAGELCDRGVRFHTASPDDLYRLRSLTQPVVDDLAADPENGPILRQLTELADDHPALEGVPVPAICADQGAANDVGSIPTTPSEIPEGEYRVQISTADVERAGMTNAIGNTGVWTLTIRDATFSLRCTPVDDPGIDCGHATFDGPLEVGDLYGEGNDVYFAANGERMARETGCNLDEGECTVLDPYRMTWRLTGDQMVFTHFVPEGANQWLVKPWTKIS